MWAALTEQAIKDGTLDADLTVKQIMDTWTRQKGYPLVTVTRSYSAKTVTLKQDWFLLNPNNKVSPSVKGNAKWYVGFSHTTSQEKDFAFDAPVVWLKPNETSSKHFFFTFLSLVIYS